MGFSLDLINDLFTHSVNTVQDQLTETPTEFSPTIVESLRAISETAVMPVAGLILVYAFCYEIYNLVTEKNRGNDFDTSSLFYLIFKTAIVILLITNSFTITLAFFDVGQWMVQQIPESTLSMTEMITSDIKDSIDGFGDGLGMLALSMVAMLFTFIMSGIIYLVAWSRMVTIMLYISIAPLPFATLMNKDWIGAIGQNYIKQLLALMLQGFFMIVCLIVYAGLLEKASILMTQESRPIFGLLLMMVSMGILTLALAKTHSYAKSAIGVI